MVRPYAICVVAVKLNNPPNKYSELRITSPIQTHFTKFIIKLRRFFLILAFVILFVYFRVVHFFFGCCCFIYLIRWLFGAQQLNQQNIGLQWASYKWECHISMTKCPFHLNFHFKTKTLSSLIYFFFLLSILFENCVCLCVCM